MDGWKVVKVSLGRMYSIAISFRRKGRWVPANEYRYGEFTWPREEWGPLTVFANIVDASNFASLWTYEEIRICKCKYTPSPLESVWDLLDNSDHIDQLPVGTVLAESIMLLEEYNA